MARKADYLEFEKIWEKVRYIEYVLREEEDESGSASNFSGFTGNSRKSLFEDYFIEGGRKGTMRGGFLRRDTARADETGT